MCARVSVCMYFMAVFTRRIPFVRKRAGACVYTRARPSIIIVEKPVQ